MMTWKKNKGFSLVELVVVIVIIGIIAAMAIPRISRGTDGLSDTALAGNLAMMRQAVAHYAAEHEGDIPTTLATQLTMYSDKDGNTSAIGSSSYPFGPYLVAIPPCPVGSQTDPDAVATDTTDGAIPEPTADTGGWIFNTKTGEIRANTNATDDSSTKYFTY